MYSVLWDTTVSGTTIPAKSLVLVHPDDKKNVMFFKDVRILFSGKVFTIPSGRLWYEGDQRMNLWFAEMQPEETQRLNKIASDRIREMFNAATM